MTVFFPLIASEGGFGINLNLFETNLINLVIVIGVLVLVPKRISWRHASAPTRDHPS